MAQNFDIFEGKNLAQQQIFFFFQRFKGQTNMRSLLSRDSLFSLWLFWWRFVCLTWFFVGFFCNLYDLLAFFVWRKLSMYFWKLTCCYHLWKCETSTYIGTDVIRLAYLLSCNEMYYTHVHQVRYKTQYAMAFSQNYREIEKKKKKRIETKRNNFARAHK